MVYSRAVPTPCTVGCVYGRMRVRNTNYALEYRGNPFEPADMHTRSYIVVIRLNREDMRTQSCFRGWRGRQVAPLRVPYDEPFKARACAPEACDVVPPPPPDSPAASEPRAHFLSGRGTRGGTGVGGTCDPPPTPRNPSP